MSEHPCGPEHGFRVDCIRYYSAIEKKQKELEDENKRLRKAGDAMSSILIGRITSHEIGYAIDQWDAAKGGKPSV